ncbi:hypothetical protein Y032_0038g3658 [Ancylostoma ceylanicum]|uniref:Neurotransmitter-gated ion-channel transmembrane region n=2 Tax=Ancylostoma ceylanicum TaxID=53326 RepID=A0A016UKX3_9BILA|nr:hypothetical protein Y032_0038g3658 [Ancylostoma ceylanicum]
MKLQLFPMDSQRCKLEIESYGYSILDINYVFASEKSVTRSEFELPQFVLVDVKISNKTEKLSSGEYSRLVSYFLFKRNIGFYIIQIYLPSVLIVVISWVSFWLSRDATPARVALGVTTVLTMTTLMTTTNSAMPKVSYVKSIDIFLGVCFMMVFCSLLEYAAVGYINKRMKLNERKKESRAIGNFPSPMEPPPTRTVSVPAYFNRGYRPFYSSTDTNSNLYIPESQRVPLTLQELDCHCPAPPDDEPRLSRISAVSSIVALKPNRRIWPSWNCLRPSNIDKISRWSFPTIFVLFNVGYWSYFLRINGYTTADIDYFWGRQKSDHRQGAVAFDKFMLPQFKQTGYNVNITKAVTSSGEYVRLYFEVLLVRNMGFYSMNIVIPSMLIVTISWRCCSLNVF